MWHNVGFFFPMMVAVVTAVITGYAVYRTQQQQLQQVERDSERRRQRIQTLEERLAEIERRDREEEARKRRRARDFSSRQAEGSESLSGVDPCHVDALEAKINDLEADRVCLICFDNLRSVVFDCSHLVACDACAGKLEICPMCRSFIVERRTVLI